MLRSFWIDEHGVIISAELVMVATLLVIGLVVGLSELQHAVVHELNDVGEAIGSLNQSYFYDGFEARKTNPAGGVKSRSEGSEFEDDRDDCDNNQCSISCRAPIDETNKNQP